MLIELAPAYRMQMSRKLHCKNCLKSFTGIGRECNLLSSAALLSWRYDSLHLLARAGLDKQTNRSGSHFHQHDDNQSDIADATVHPVPATQHRILQSTLAHLCQVCLQSEYSPTTTQGFGYSDGNGCIAYKTVYTPT